MDLFAADFEPIPLPDAELAMLRNALGQDSRALAADTHSGDALAFRNDPDVGQARTTAAPDRLVRRSRRRVCLFWNRTRPASLDGDASRHQAPDLQRRHLDLDRGGLRLEAEWTKNRRPGFQPLPRYLLEKLAGTGTSPSKPLLQVPSHPTRTFDRDIQEAGIGKVNPDGVLVFHSWRATYATPMLTMQRYVQAQLGRRQELVEGIANLVWSARGVPNRLAADDECSVTPNI